MMEKIALAYAFAAKAHAGQKRRGGELYINHPIRVAARVAEVSDDADTLIAAILHDVVEDSPATFDEISDLFGPDVAVLLWWVTDDEAVATLPRKARKAAQVTKITQAPLGSRLIKMADQIDNIESILQGYETLPMKFREDYPVAAMEVIRACMPASQVLLEAAEVIMSDLNARSQPCRPSPADDPK